MTTSTPSTARIFLLRLSEILPISDPELRSTLLWPELKTTSHLLHISSSKTTASSTSILLLSPVPTARALDKCSKSRPSYLSQASSRIFLKWRAKSTMENNSSRKWLTLPSLVNWQYKTSAVPSPTSTLSALPSEQRSRTPADTLPNSGWLSQNLPSLMCLMWWSALKHTFSSALNSSSKTTRKTSNSSISANPVNWSTLRSWSADHLAEHHTPRLSISSSR